MLVIAKSGGVAVVGRVVVVLLTLMVVLVLTAVLLLLAKVLGNVHLAHELLVAVAVQQVASALLVVLAEHCKGGRVCPR